MATKQCMEALARATATRQAAFLVRKEVAAGELSIADALHDPRAGSLEIETLLRCQRRWAQARVGTLLNSMYLSPKKRVRERTERQKRVIAEACGETVALHDAA